MSIVDSAAAFERKCKELRGGDDLFTGLKNLGVSDFSTLAFTLGTPQKAPSDEQFAELGNKVFGVPTIGQLALLRKLHFEATTLMVASINEQVKSDTADPTTLAKRLPAAEKQSRLETQTKRLAGLRLVGELSPSHLLLDLTNAMVETGVLSWIAPSRCAKRDDEIQANIKPATSTLQIEQSTLKVAQVPVAAPTDVGSELKLQWAFQRRGVAMDQCRLLDWSYHEDWIQWLLQTITKDVPAGFSSVKLDQIVRADKELADKELWTILAQQQTKSLKPQNDTPVLNEDFKKLTTDPRVTMYVLPLPTSTPRTTPNAQPKKTATKPTPTGHQDSANKRRKTTRAEKNCPEELRKYTLRLEGKGNICGSCGQKRNFSEVSEGVDIPAAVHDNVHVEQLNSKSSSSSTCIEPPGPSPKFAGVAIEDLLVIEICAGSARLTKTCRKLGLRGLAVDKTTDRSCGIDIMILDLTISSQLQLLLDIIRAERDRILMIFIAPPCGTASRARGRPIKSSLLRGRRAPVPLRTDEQPDGKDSLTGTDKLKTELANQLYAAITQVILFAVALTIFVVVENPANSLYWKTSFALEYTQSLTGCVVDFHNCSHGGTRDKLTRFWCSDDWLSPLQVFCDGSHPHESWRPRIQNIQLIFPTAQEAAYPWLLCTRIANLALAAAENLGAVRHLTLASQMEQQDFSMMNRYIFGALPRSTKLRPLVPEFATFFFVITPAQHVDNGADALTGCPKGSKLISRRLWKWGKFRAEEYCGDKCKFLGLDEKDLDEDFIVECFHVGVPHEPLAFLQQAIWAGHPKDLKRHVGEAMQEVVLDNFHRPPHQLAQKRVDFIRKYTNLAGQLKADELKLRYSMPPHIRKIMVGKRLALFGRMLSDLEFPDKDLVKDIANGFKLSLWTPSEVAEYACGDGAASSAYEPESACGDLQSEEQLASAVVTPEFSDVNLDACVQTALSSRPALAPKPIWDEGVWSAIFGNGILMQLDFCNTELHKPPVSECLDSWLGQIDECRRSLKRSLPRDCSEHYMGAVRHVTDQSWEEERESQLQMALKRWLVVVISFNNTTLVWRQLAEEQDDLAKMVVLSDLFRGRAPGTLLKRAKGPGETVQSLWDRCISSYRG
eukprot:s5862_g4.t1